MGISAERVALHGINKCQKGIMICIITVSRAHSEKAQSPPHATTPPPKKNIKKNIQEKPESTCPPGGRWKETGSSVP